MPVKASPYSTSPAAQGFIGFTSCSPCQRSACWLVALLWTLQCRYGPVEHHETCDVKEPEDHGTDDPDPAWLKPERCGQERHREEIAAGTSAENRIIASINPQEGY